MEALIGILVIVGGLAALVALLQFALKNALTVAVVALTLAFLLAAFGGAYP
jgi:hypothetical protein